MSVEMRLYDKILRTIDDLSINFMYYDRKEDEDLMVGTIENMIKENHITVDDIVNRFRKNIESCIK